MTHEQQLTHDLLYPGSTIAGQKLTDKRTIQEAFEEFHRTHPDVYDVIVSIARQVKAKGYTKYSCHAILERVRWFYKFERENTWEDFKISNNHGSRYARMVMERNEDLEGFFTLHELKAE
jgi:hypothetical protein